MTQYAQGKHEEGTGAVVSFEDGRNYSQVSNSKGTLALAQAPPPRHLPSGARLIGGSQIEIEHSIHMNSIKTSSWEKIDLVIRRCIVISKPKSSLPHGLTHAFKRTM
jgi:hypothetical protein